MPLERSSGGFLEIVGVLRGFSAVRRIAGITAERIGGRNDFDAFFLSFHIFIVG
jgi:hypothetical protein